MNLTLTLQLAPATNAAPQFVDALTKSPASVPPKAMFEILTLWLLDVFVTVTVWAAEVLPTEVEENTNDAGRTLSRVPVPVRLIL